MPNTAVARTAVPIAPKPQPANDRVAQLVAWEHEAREWATTQIIRVLNESTEALTTAQVMHVLDTLKAPAGWEIMRANERARYQFVRRILLALVKRNAIEAVSTFNSRKRACSAFQRIQRHAPKLERPRRRRTTEEMYNIEIEGGNPEIKGKMEDFLKSLGMNFDAVLVTKR